MGMMANSVEQLENERAKFRTSYRKGHDYLEKDAKYKTFGIDVSYFDVFKHRYPYDADCTSWHGNQIAIYGDEALRDRILASLQESA